MGRKRRGQRVEYRFIQRTRKGWRGWYTVAGERHFCRVRATQKEAHEDALRERSLTAPMPSKGRTLERAFDLITRDLKTAGRRPDTEAWYRCQFAAITKAWPAKTSLRRIDRRQVQDFIDGRLIDGVSGSTIRHHLRALSRAFRLAMREDWVSVDPTTQVTKPRASPKDRPPIDRDELFRRVEELAPADADLVVLLFCTGLRKSEAARMRVEDVDIGAGVLSIPEGKTNSARLPLPGETLDVLFRMASSGHVVPGSTFARRKDCVRRVLERCQRQFGERANDDEVIPDRRWTPHNLRHSLGHHLERLGVRDRLIVAALRHKAEERQRVTLRYRKPHDEDLREALACAWRPSPATRDS